MTRMRPQSTCWCSPPQTTAGRQFVDIRACHPKALRRMVYSWAETPPEPKFKTSPLNRKKSRRFAPNGVRRLFRSMEGEARQAPAAWKLWSVVRRQ
jgi:hypothetical protein